MKAGTFERDEVLALSLLSAMSGESIFLLGLPGVGKSMVARRLKTAFKDATVFEYLMSRFSTPDEIFGPVSISKLKDEDCYERMTGGYLPEAEVVFLDEIWKAGPAIQNSLLTVLNEKIYLNGNRELNLPIKGIIAASNELPAKDEGLEALWDRFLLRYIVNPINSKQNFFHLLSPSESNIPSADCNPISHEEYVECLKQSRMIPVPVDMLEIIYQIRGKLNDKINAKDVVTGEQDPENLKYYVSDRRWKKAVGVMRMSAYLNGRNEVDLSDVLLLAHILWTDEESMPFIRKILAESVVAFTFRNLLDQYKSYKRHVQIEKETSNKLFSPDRIHYIILCDDTPLKIKIADYNRMKSSPGEIYFGSETTDNVLTLRSRGQFVMQFVKEGVVCINNYNYYLRTESDNQFSKDFIAELSERMDGIVNQLYLSMNHNVFIAGSDLYIPIRETVAVYRERMNLM